MHTDLMNHINEVHADMEKLESEGFTWMKDSLRGMFYQLGAPRSGNFGMDAVNVSLDGQFCLTGIPFSSKDIRTAMQSQIASKKTALAGHMDIEAMTMVFRGTSIHPCRLPPGPAPHRMSHSNTALDRRRPGDRSSSGLSSTSSAQRIAPRQQITPNNKEREASIKNPVEIPSDARREVINSLNQCFYCGSFDHFFGSCSDLLNRLPKRAPHWNNWRKVHSGCMYSVDVLYPNRQMSARALDVAPEVLVSAVGMSAKGLLLDECAVELILDSGATHAVTSDGASLLNFRTLTSPIPLVTAAKSDRL